MESLDSISNRYTKMLTGKNKECILESDKYILYFNHEEKNGDKLFRCKFYKDTNIKCKAFVKYNQNNQLISYNDQHSCVVDEKKIKALKIKSEAKKIVGEENVIYDIKARNIFDSSVKKIVKRKSDEEPKEEIDNQKKDNIPINYKQNMTPSFSSVRASIYRYINKNVPKDIEDINDLPEESEYYNTIKGDKFLFYKNENILIFMSTFQANLLYQYPEHIFIDGTFYAAPKCSYQIVTIRLHELKEDQFYTVGYGIMTSKNLGSYIEFLDNIKTYVYNNRENKRNINPWFPKVMHCDFEIAIISAIKQVFPNTEIKLCLLHLFRNLEINRKKIYGSIENQDNISLNILKRIKTLCYIDPDFVKDVFILIIEDANNSDENDKKFVIDYFKKNYIEKYNIKEWNYYKVYDHRTNNACESYHHALNSKFNSKPSIWKFISVLRDEENKLKLEIENLRNDEIVKKRKRIDIKVIMKKYYDVYDERINKINNDNIDNKHEELVNLWYEAALELPLYDCSI